MSEIKRVFLIVLDSVGAGEAPDAELFGDTGSHTIQTISASEKFSVPFLKKLGLGNIDGLGFLGAEEAPLGAVARMTERSVGKDTTVGHWEIAGLVSDRPFPVYPEGFPQEIIDRFSEAVGRGVLCNKPYSGTEVIRDYGREHVKTGDLIVYTSADSVFQIAAHEDIVPVEELYACCRAARKILTGEHAVGRVIARPFEGEWPYTRTSRRHDFSVVPEHTVLDDIKAAGLDVISVGKINDIFAGAGVTESYPTADNRDGMRRTDEMASGDFAGLCFVNLVEFDMTYGHRRDIDGYAAAMTDFDAWLSGFAERLRPEDAVIITADHGCDPGFTGTDHTREYTPMIAFGQNIRPGSRGTRASFADIAATAAQLLGVPADISGESFAEDILK